MVCGGDLNHFHSFLRVSRSSVDIYGGECRKVPHPCLSGVWLIFLFLLLFWFVEVISTISVVSFVSRLVRQASMEGSVGKSHILALINGVRLTFLLCNLMSIDFKMKSKRVSSL